jgi:uncharacterized protein YutE (UPF0331/DUF86 family)
VPVNERLPQDIERRLARLGDVIAAAAPDVMFAYLFGSTAAGSRRTPRSDIDLAVYVSDGADVEAARRDVAHAAAKHLGWRRACFRISESASIDCSANDIHVVDRDLVLRKVAGLDEYLAQLGPYRTIEVAVYASDWKTQRIVERTLHLVIETCMDIADHVVADRQLRVPETGAETFDVLAEAGVFSKSLGAALGKMVGFRRRVLSLGRAWSASARIPTGIPNRKDCSRASPVCGLRSSVSGLRTAVCYLFLRCPYISSSTNSTHLNSMSWAFFSTRR